MLSGPKKPVPSEKDLKMHDRWAMARARLLRLSALRALANAALIAVLVDLCFRIHSDAARFLMVLACIFLVFRPMLFLLLTVLFLVKISRVKSYVAYTCPACGCELWTTVSHCPQCGIELQWEDTSGGTGVQSEPK